ncbi:ribosome maturation factor RimM [Chitinasiproducens palmae]|uniref:Ribosome maturation factor RimM n=1 Tax=Chitinasiproducens palmae TaxID=1770053 RepID=A0A1H2PUL8_9BURK|nr:ribosome maturation factor RimM [Chitinasiproducens palmae]SDV50898.1 16S rRNA processing protein RimM [Chitinasiproducens palmae]
MSESRPFGAFVPRAARGEKGAASARPVDAETGSAGAGDAVHAPHAAGEPPADLIEVGVILQAYGVRGQVKVVPHGQGGDALLNARTWWIDRHGALSVVSGVRARLHSGSVVAGWAGCDDRDAAEALRGARIKVRRGDFPTLPDGEFYWVDLIGITVSNPSGDVLGTVVDLVDNGAHSVLRVVAPGTGDDAVERLIPFVDAYLVEVDVPGRRIVVDWQLDY